MFIILILIHTLIIVILNAFFKHLFIVFFGAAYLIKIYTLFLVYALFLNNRASYLKTLFLAIKFIDRLVLQL